MRLSLPSSATTHRGDGDAHRGHIGGRNRDRGHAGRHPRAGAAARRFRLDLDFDFFDFASCDYYLEHGRMLPKDWKQQIGSHDALFFGAVGWPQKVPDHISLWGSLLQFRREFDQYVNLRPVRLMPGVPSPLAGREPGDIDFMVVRENTEGEYSSVGGRMFPGTEREIVLQETVMSRIGVDRILRFAFELARARPKRHLTSATKSNGISITMPYWDERVEAMAAAYPDVRWDKDISTSSARASCFSPTDSTSWSPRTSSAISFRTWSPPARARSASRLPPTSIPSAASRRSSNRFTDRPPTSRGRGIANPIGQIWTGAMMLEHLGYVEAADAIVRAVERTLADPATAQPT